MSNNKLTLPRLERLLFEACDISAGKKGGEFYTASEVARLLAPGGELRRFDRVTANPLSHKTTARRALPRGRREGVPQTFRADRRDGAGADEGNRCRRQRINGCVRYGGMVEMNTVAMRHLSRNTAKVTIVTLSGSVPGSALRRKTSEGSRFGKEILRWRHVVTRI